MYIYELIIIYIPTLQIKREYYNTIEEAKEARKKWIKKNFKAEIRGRPFYEEIDQT